MTTIVHVNNPNCLSWKYPGVEGITTKQNHITHWPDSLPELTQDLIFSIDTEYARLLEINDIKSEAEKEILDLIPEWKQRNMLAEAILELIDFLDEEGVFKLKDLEKRVKATELLDIWNKVIEIRTKSDDKEREM